MEHSEPERAEHDKVADAFERDADEMARENAALESEIAEVRKDWEAKRRDQGVPGAVAPDPDTAPAGDDDPEPAAEND